jgi:hypothetical protein
MINQPEKIALAFEGDHFSLRRGGQVLAALSFDDVLAIANAAPNFRQTILAHKSPGAVFATPVRETTAIWDALGANILLQIRFEPDGNAIYELSMARSQELANRLNELVANRPAFSSSH